MGEVKYAIMGFLSQVIGALSVGFSLVKGYDATVCAGIAAVLVAFLAAVFVVCEAEKTI